jgi:uncharacterized repeat protein (TIGR03843 family)
MTAADTSSLLLEGAIEPLGRLSDASNDALLVRVGGEAAGAVAVYKPVAGERPLWDFPDGTLAEREVAAYAISQAGGWGAVPTTVLREGPLGVGSVQEWVGSLDEPPGRVVEVFPPNRVPEGWHPVLEGEGRRGEPLVVAHADTPEVRAMAVFDVVLNNSDRKGSHLLVAEGRLFGIDHGVSLHTEPKLRTILWGWAGEPIPRAEQERVAAVATALAEPDSPLRSQLERLLTPAEVAALKARCHALLEYPAYPVPSGRWPAIPWPPL